MARTRVARLAFNRGIVSRLGLARADISRLALAAETQTNWVPRVLGSMMIRPGTKYIASTRSNNASRTVPFVFSINDKANIELTANKMRVFVSDVVISRTSVSTAVANSGFDSNVTSWTDNDEAGAASVWVTGGYLGLTGTGTNAAIRDQQVTVAAADQNVEHALKIVIQRGPVILRVGSTSGNDDYISETELDTGEHSLAFTPTGDFHIRFMSRLERQVLVDSCAVEAAGDMTLNTPWAESDLDLITANTESQSGDIIFVACQGYQERKIERRGTRSWSCVRYQSNDGPFRAPNIGPITLTASALSGNITLTASAALFKSTHAPSTHNDGALFRITSNGQSVSQSIAAQNTFTNAIMVEGVDAQRIFTVSIDEDTGGGAAAATFTLQRSLESDSGPWTDVQQYTADTTTTFDDGLDNQTAWYRLGVKTGDYSSGTHTVSLNYTVGSIAGVVRVTGFTSSTQVSAEVLTDLGGTSATDNWEEGSWSDRRGWPSAGTFYEGRLWWAGKNGIFGSISDGFYSFDDTVEGDSGPINRTIGAGPVDVVNWILPLLRLVFGAQAAEIGAKSSSFDEILTPTNFNPKPVSTHGSSYVQAVKIDSNGLFVHRGGTRVFQLELSAESADYGSSDVTALAPEVCEPEVVRMAVQRLPDTRVHCVLSDGTVAMLVYDKLENVLCWLKIVSDGADGVIEDVYVLPGGSGDKEDAVYYQVKRTINGATVRYHEKWALESECRPTNGTLTACKLADSHIAYSGAATTTITAAHLAGEEVVVWAGGADIGTDTDGSLIYTLDGSGNATLPSAVTNYVVGLPYSASWKSARLIESMQIPEGSLGDKQSIKGLQLILADVHAKGLKIGRSLTESEMVDLPEIGENGAAVGANEIRTSYTTEKNAFPGGFSNDARLCLLAKAPRPVTVLAAIAELEHNG